MKNLSHDSQVVLTVIIASLIVLLAIVLLVRSKRRITVAFKTLWAKFKLDAEDSAPPSAPGVILKDAKSEQGSIHLDDQTGRGAQGERLVAAEHIIAQSKPPESGSPKRHPRAN